MQFDDSDNLAVEIQQEKAAAYFAACRKAVDALEALNAFDLADCGRRRPGADRAPI